MNIVAVGRGEIQVKDNLVRIKGVASTGSIDRDGERVLVEGINFKPLLEYGYFTYEHNPFNVIGFPIKAWIKDGKMYVEGILFKDNPLVKYLMRIQRSFAKSEGWGMRGVKMSIEGYPRVKEGGIIKRVDVVNVAITLYPVNPETWAVVSKAFSLENMCKVIKGEMVFNPITMGYETDSRKMEGGDALREEGELGEIINILNALVMRGDEKILNFIQRALRRKIHPSYALLLLGLKYKYGQKGVS